MPEKKKDPLFKKVENGMVFQSEDGKTIAVGLPTQVEELKAGEGKLTVTLIGGKGEAKGATYSRTNYEWRFISPEAISEGKVVEYGKEVSAVSGTTPVILTSSQTVQSSSMIIQPGVSKICQKCNFVNPDSNDFCGKCGTRLNPTAGELFVSG